MRTLTAIGLAALLVTLGACGGGDDDKPQQPVPGVPVTPEPPRPDPLPLVEGPFWPPVFQEELAFSYLDPAPNEVKFRALIEPLAFDYYRITRRGEIDIIPKPCSFDPAGLPFSDPSRPAKMTFGDKVVLDPAAFTYVEGAGRWLVQPQFSPYVVALTSGAAPIAFAISVGYNPAENTYGTSVEAWDGETKYSCHK